MLVLGAVLTKHDDEGREFVVAYTNCSKNVAESKVSLDEKESLILVWVVRHFRYYLFGAEFTLVTNQ